jgi:hypothetical protein
MSNQIQITGGAKVRSLEGVITGTSGILSSVPLGAANGVATLDSSGKVPVSQLPSSVVTYLGTWNAATNTPTLVNGTGDAGDLYLCNVAGTVNFGAGPITFAVGDWVLYGSGTWQKSNGQNGTVTSVAASITGNAVGITGSPITTAGTLAFAFAGTNLQYVNGAGDLTTFPSLTGYIPYTGATTSIDLNNQSVVNISHLGINTTTVPTILLRAIGDNNSSSRIAMRGYSSNANSSSIRVTKFRGTAGAPQAPLSGDSLGKFELAGYGTTSSDGYPQASFEGIATENWGATARGSKTVIKITPNTTITQAIALTINQDKSAVFENSITGTSIIKTGGTSSQFLKADGSVDSTSYITLGSLSATSPIFYNNTTGVISSQAATTSVNGYLTSTDWNTFNNKATASGTTAQVAFYNGSSSLTSSSQFWYFNSYSRLGIGDFSSITPVAALSTISTVGAWYNRTSASASYNGIGLSFDSGGYGHLFQTDKVGAGSVAANVSFLNNNTVLSLDENYNVGINTRVPVPGTTGPGGVGLDIFGGSSAAALALHNTASGLTSADGGRLYLTTSLSLVLRNFETGGVSITADAGDFSVIQGGSEKIKAAYGGYVGIMAPASIPEALTVNGSIQQSGITSTMVKVNSLGKFIAAVSGTDYIVLDSLSATSPIFYNSSTGVISSQAASASLAGYVTTGTQTIAGAKTFSSAAVFSSTINAGGAINVSGTGIIAISVASSDNFVLFQLADNRVGGKVWNIENGRSTSGVLGFYASTSGTNVLELTQAGAGTFSSSVTASSFIKSGGTSSQFLKADGSVDSSSYFSLPSLTSGSVLFSNGSTIAQNNTKFYWDNTNMRLGIGTQAVSQYVTYISANVGENANAWVGIENKNTTGSTALRLLLNASIKGGFLYDQSTNLTQLYSQGADLLLSNSSSLGVRIFSSTGNVSINNSTDSGYKLDVTGSSSPSLRVRNGALGGTATLLLETANDFSGTCQTYIKCIGTTSNGTSQLAFATSRASGDATATEAMRITSGGDLGIGTSSISYALTNRRSVEINGAGYSILALKVAEVNQCYLYANGNGGDCYFTKVTGANSLIIQNSTGGVYLGVGSTSWSAVSDIRLKNINSNIENALDSLMTLQTINFSWKSDLENKENLGLIAQEVQKVFPQVIGTAKFNSNINNENSDETEYLSVRYTELIPVLVKAIQEMNTKSEEQQALITSLQSQINELKNK